MARAPIMGDDGTLKAPLQSVRYSFEPEIMIAFGIGFWVVLSNTVPIVLAPHVSVANVTKSVNAFTLFSLLNQLPYRSKK